MKNVIQKTIVLVLIAAFASVSSAEWLTWTGAAGDNMLSTPGNYEMTNDPYTPWTTPLSGDIVEIKTTADVVLDEYESLNLARVSVGDTGDTVNTSLELKPFSSLVLSGNTYSMMIGRNGSYGTVTVAQNAYLELNGDYFTIGNQAPGDAILNVSGTVHAKGNIPFTWGGSGTGTINLYDGEMIVDGWMQASAGTTINIEDGKLLIAHAAGQSNIQNAIDNNQVYGYGTAGNVNVAYVDRNGTEYMEVTAIPEPATLSLLALGGILFTRKRK